MPRSDFVWVNFDARLNQGNPAETREFHVDGELHDDDGYLLVQALGVESRHHRILVNDRDLPSFDLPAAAVNNALVVWRDRIPTGFLRNGRNEITIRRGAADDFTVLNVVIHWRETVTNFQEP